MSSPALDLLARLVAEQVADMACERCGARLNDSKVTLRGRRDGRVLAEVTCRACGHASFLGIQPEGVDGGVAGLH